MDMFENYEAARERANERNLIALRDRPFTCLSGFAAGMSIVGALVYVFAFSDFSDQRRSHALRAAPVVAALVICFFVFNWFERKPFPIAVRRAVWWSIIVVYGVGFLIAVVTIINPFSSRLGSPYLLIKLGATFPIPAIAWSLLKRRDSV
jgi:uncharacterized membrane protein HdeD (DUF308 family)